MLIGKKCDFKTDHGIEYTGIIVEKYNGIYYANDNLSIDFYIVNIGDTLKHIPCSSLVKIHNESVPVIDKDLSVSYVDNTDIFDKAVEYVQENYYGTEPMLLLGNVAELIEITTGKKVDYKVLAKYSK